jgi:hypothetical protein
MTQLCKGYCETLTSEFAPTVEVCWAVLPDDTVLVAAPIPYDPAAPFVAGRTWSKSNLTPADFQSGDAAEFVGHYPVPGLSGSL